MQYFLFSMAFVVSVYSLLAGSPDKLINSIMLLNLGALTTFKIDRRSCMLNNYKMFAIEIIHRLYMHVVISLL